MRHDLKNAFAALSGYLNEGDIENARRFVEQKTEKLGELVYNTGHPAVDAVVNAKRTRAVKEQIQFDAKITLPEKLYMDEMDLCIIIGNALDNALEACEKMPPGQGKIILFLRRSGDMLFIEVKTLKNMMGSLTLKTLSILRDKPSILRTPFKSKRKHAIFRLSKRINLEIAFLIHKSWK